MSPAPHDLESERLTRRLGLRNGLLIGIALALGTWIYQAISLCLAHVQAACVPLLLGFFALTLLGGLAGWLSAWRDSAPQGALVWFLLACAMTWIVGHAPHEGRNLSIWLADRRFWGLPIYSYGPAARARLLMAGFFVVLLLTILGLLQSQRLEGIASETDARGRLGARAWLLLCLPLPFVLVAGLIADDLVNSPERAAVRLVHEAIRTGRTYAGDLFELSLQRGVNYNAVAGVRDLMAGNYSLLVGEATLGAANSFVVVAQFDNDAWIDCRVTAGQLLNCYDASPPYRLGFPALLASGQTPQDCRECSIEASDKQRDWLRAHGESWAGSPRVTRLAQWGSYVLMQALSPTGDDAVECLFSGLSPVTLDRCW
jgi:hypothetical protein